MLDYFFNPKSVAVIGATDNKLKGGFHIVRNALAGYKGTVYPVNVRKFYITRASAAGIRHMKGRHSFLLSFAWKQYSI